MRLIKLLLLLSLSMLVLDSCKDACEDINCGVNGTCLDGICNCDAGYSGTNCEVNVCDSIDCGANGSCDTTTGACICNDGYEGDNCDTESRAKYYGTFTGNLVPCLHPIAAGLVPADQKEILEMTPIEVFESATGVNFVEIGSTSDVIDLNVDADLREDEFTIPEFTQDIDIAGSIVTVSGSGVGKFIDENAMELTFNLKYKIDILELESSCTEIFSKM